MDSIAYERCRCCGEHKPICEFAKNKKRKSGVYIYCRSCLSKKYYAKKGVDAKNIRKKIGVRNMRDEAIRILGGKCSRCGFDDFRALQIDHINGDGAEERRVISQWKVYKKIMML